MEIFSNVNSTFIVQMWVIMQTDYSDIFKRIFRFGSKMWFPMQNLNLSTEYSIFLTRLIGFFLKNE